VKTGTQEEIPDRVKRFQAKPVNRDEGDKRDFVIQKKAVSSYPGESFNF